MKFERRLLYLYQTAVFLGIVIVYFLSLNKTLEFTSMSLLMPSIMATFFLFMTYTNIFDENKELKKDKTTKIYLYFYSLPLFILSIAMIIHLFFLFN
ncbi:hypothetical protein [Macrococcoides caseolyticum]|uniref:hypothetical protein n=1 Tax=Macrococcoides caseolyticum TaxID=69966 RepID=UPI000C32D7E9|nr:hypothetical protein [Macrococcus caseolyticus]PKE16178.1 hypothetical protein CW718_11010 [Macrococcus caseolyticus]PKE52079.1 hypothetical protein CW676_11290 [Macrococcus caseolyticus]PKE73543.1 hypothetical protein CW670_11485 [Macrococcus caseolyticus]PKF05304.1 hypothetical protein CW698_10625 [Macrococcus caseolyticus]PKF20393.1 hypothetical protein CW684_11015 [Macrococcus caseolyticus]